MDDDVQQKQMEEKDVDQVEEKRDKTGETWKVSNLVGGRMKYIPIKQAIKLILGRK